MPLQGKDQNDKKNLQPVFSIKKSRIDGANVEKEQANFEPEKFIYLDIDEEITHVFDKIKRLRQKKIALVIPNNSVLLQSVINLKILKKKTDELGKDIIIITSDLSGKQLAQKAGLTTSEHIFSSKENTEPIDALKPIIAGSARKFADEKISISDVVRKKGGNMFQAAFDRWRERVKKQKQEKQGKPRLVFIAPNKQALFTLILVSVLLLLAIAYIALPGATITLTPKSTILDPSFNVSFLEANKNRATLESSFNPGIVVASHKLQPTQLTKKIMYPATGKIFKGQNASGTITIYNSSQNPWELAATTRFQTPDGIVFRIQSPVRVPPAKGYSAGSLDVRVIADEFDVNGQIVGDRGNIGPTKFFLPGIKNEENRKKIYGESKTAMTGGTSQSLKMVSKEDVEAAESKIREQINKTASDDLKKYLEQQNLVNKTNWSLLDNSNVVSVSNIQVSAPDGIIGTANEQFETTATYSVTGIAYDNEELTNLIKERLVNKADPDKKIVRIEDDKINFHFLDQDEAAGKVRFTATMRAIQVYDLDPEKENGRRFLKKVTDHIVGLSIQDAEEYLQQQTDEIARVQISTWPVWAPTVPNIADNIKFTIKNDDLL